MYITSKTKEQINLKKKFTMNCFSCFLLVIVLCAGLSNAKFNEKNSVIFKNALGPKKVLRISCTSDNDEIGYIFLKRGQIYQFSFHDSVFKTKFDCELSKGSGGFYDYNFYAKFRAYTGGGLIVHYGKKNFWEAREDGIYFTHGKEIPKLEYKWIPGDPIDPPMEAKSPL
ncbi:S-protein homolog 10 [Arabidopsis lyrata subsp. lyrata]|uniref:S-protein homolog 10 n=1 Tax=Arabidopsis lyrata subsp. lyrata TaxID=81972 RepID=UPI000A29E12B|nr:S-protein homolog 10 [Arabidopsis lyrata subsp. lyrata]|eukprot:XP_020882805.1 S-protein homolog 10 [Arabidopsis lyrata subsp. lyrata]